MKDVIDIVLLLVLAFLWFSVGFFLGSVYQRAKDRKGKNE